MPVQIALIGDYDAAVKAHVAIPRALQQSASDAGVDVETVWLATESVPSADLDSYDGIWCVPASPYRSMEGALEAIRFARETGRPFMGTCGGFQHALIEYARNVMGLKTADHAEVNPQCDEPVVAQLTCSLVEVEQDIDIIPGTKLADIYRSTGTREGHRCSFGLNPKYRSRFEAAGICTSAVGPDGEVKAMEWPAHRFFIGVLFQPERWALRGQANPLVTAFIKAAAKAPGERDLISSATAK